MDDLVQRLSEGTHAVIVGGVAVDDIHCDRLGAEPSEVGDAALLPATPHPLTILGRGGRQARNSRASITDIEQAQEMLIDRPAHVEVLAASDQRDRRRRRVVS